MCLQPAILRIIYLVKIFLNIIRFGVPIVLIIKILIDVYKNVINPDSKGEIIKNIKNRIIAAIIVFLVPTIINFVMSVIGKATGENSYNGISECWEFSTLEYIEIIEEEQKEARAEAYLLEWEKNLDEANQAKIAYRRMLESKTKVDKIGEYANNENTIICGSGSKYNTGLYNVVRSAEYKTRKGVVAAALYLSSHINVHIPYFWSGGHFHDYGNYYDGGVNFMGVSDKWGCSVKMPNYDSNDSLQESGEVYPFGMDCSGFVVWAIYNGGYYTGDSNQKLTIPTDSSISSLGEISVRSVSLKNSKGQVQAGDIVWKQGHVGLVVEVSDEYIMVAEEKGTKYGLVLTKVKYNSGDFTEVILMDNFYDQYMKNKPMWEGFY